MKWSYEQLENINCYDFALEVLRERLRNHKRKSSPYCKKLQETISYMETNKNM